METYEGQVKVRFPFDNKVHDAKIVGYTKEGIAMLTTDDGEVHKFTVAELVRYLVRGHIWTVKSTIKKSI